MKLTSKYEMRNYYNPYLEQVEAKLNVQPKGRQQYAVVVDIHTDNLTEYHCRDIMEKYTALGWKVKIFHILDMNGSSRFSFNFS